MITEQTRVLNAQFSKVEELLKVKTNLSVKDLF
jgi:hypothetical protein